MTDAHEPDEVLAADAIDRLIDETWEGRPHTVTDVATAVVVSQLVTAYRAAAPPAVRDRVTATVRRARYQAVLPVRVAALGLATVLAIEGLGNLFNGRWVADSLDVAYDAHGFFESGIVFLALAAVIAVSVVRPAWLDAAALAGVPAGLALAVHGIPEIGEFPGGGILHATQGVAAVTFGVVWWLWHRRYARRRPTEGET